MPLDYGVRGRRRTLRGLWLGIVPAGLVVFTLLSFNATLHRRTDREQGWVGNRPPCPGISASAYAAKGYPARERTTDYDGAVIARQSGHVMCKAVDTPGRAGFVSHLVCQFTSPVAIRVKTAAMEAFFEPGPGSLATVSMERGGPACVLGGEFTLYSDPTN
jgi:hypothetical protein